MKRIKDIKILKDVVKDLDIGKDFYNKREIGVGDYFRDSLIVDIESLRIYAGIHNKKYGFYRMFAKPLCFLLRNRTGSAYIVAILPMKRNPLWIKQQLEERT